MYRASAIRLWGPPLENPAATILPSGWIATAKAASLLAVKLVKTRPSPLKVGSSVPSVV